MAEAGPAGHPRVRLGQGWWYKGRHGPRSPLHPTAESAAPAPPSPRCATCWAVWGSPGRPPATASPGAGVPKRNHARLDSAEALQGRGQVASGMLFTSHPRLILSVYSDCVHTESCSMLYQLSIPNQLPQTQQLKTIRFTSLFRRFKYSLAGTFDSGFLTGCHEDSWPELWS